MLPAMNVRTLSDRFRSALVIENPDPLLDEELAAQGITVERLPESATRDREFVMNRLREGGHDLLYKRSRFIVDEEVLAAAPNLAAVFPAVSVTTPWTRKRARSPGCSSSTTR
jgi:D-3-phosphoglycerate dehydrogenase